MKNKKIVLIVIICLLFVFIPASIFGLIFKRNNIYDENPNHELLYNGYLWFYKDNQLINKYKCNTKACNIATSLIDDDVYGIRYYINNDKNYSYIVHNFTFISDGDIVYLYDVKYGKVIQEYKSIKNYNTNINNDYYIIKNNDNKWGVISIGETLKLIIPFEYNFIGLVNHLDDNSNLISDKFIVSKDNKWYLMSDKGDIITSSYSYPIIDYDEKYIFIKNNAYVKIYDYNNNKALGLLEIIDYKRLEGYYAIITDKELFVYKDLSDKPIKTLNITDLDAEIKLVSKNDVIEIYANDSIISSFQK